jgi:Putative NADH-flavin reductase
MNLSVLGAAGATGIPLVEQALAAGHHVTALVRSGQKLTITNPNLRVVEGDATDRAAVSEAMNGRRRCDQRPRRERTGDDRGDARHCGRGQTEGARARRHVVLLRRRA